MKAGLSDADVEWLTEVGAPFAKPTKADSLELEDMFICGAWRCKLCSLAPSSGMLKIGGGIVDAP